MGAIWVSELTLKHLGSEKFIAGFIEQIEDEGPLVSDETIMLLDLEGVMVRVSKDVAERYAKATRINIPVLIGGTIERDGEYPAIRAISVFSLEQLHKDIGAVREIVLDCTASHKCDRVVLKKIYRLLKQYPGETAVNIINVPKDSERLAHKIKKRRVIFCPPLYFSLTTLLGEAGIRIYSDNGEKAEPRR